MSSVTNNNSSTNTPPFNGQIPMSPTSWGQAGCGSVGYSYSAIIAVMNAMQELVTLNSQQAQTQATINGDLAQANANATIAAAQENAASITDQAIGSFVSGGTTIASVALAYGMSYSDQSNADTATAQQNNFEGMQNALQNPSQTSLATDGDIEMQDMSNSRTIDDLTPAQKGLYDALTKPSATAANINDAYTAIAKQTDANGDTISPAAAKAQVAEVMKQISTGQDVQTANTNLTQAISSSSSSAKMFTDKASMTNTRFTQVGQGLASIGSAIAQMQQASASYAAGQQQALAAVLQNAQQLDSNQLQTSVGNISKAYDQELTALQMLATLAQASQV